MSKCSYFQVWRCKNCNNVFLDFPLFQFKLKEGDYDYFKESQFICFFCSKNLEGVKND